MPENAEAAPIQAWCLFQVRSRPQAVPLERVVEIVTVEHLSRFPLGPRQLLGLFVLRRDVVPVIDLDPAPAGEPSYAEEKAVVLVLQTEHGMWGVRIDREGTLLVQAAPEGVAEAAPGKEPAGGRGRVTHEGKGYSIIDPEAVWRESRGAVVAQYRPAAAGPTGPDDSHPRPGSGSGSGSVNPEAFTPKVYS